MNRTIRYHGCLGLLFGLGVTGCAGMKNTGLGPRTTPSIGDRQLGVVSGRPGEETIIRTNTASTPIDNRDVRRISGRVIDHRGQPVSGATVRLADGAASGGAVSDVITDEAGGFTVRGLRASTPYTVIATLDLGGETRVARARFLAGETQARLLLEPNTDSALASRPTPPPAQAKPSVASVQPTSPPRGRWVFVEEDGDQIASVPAARQDEKVRLTSEDQLEQEDLPPQKSSPNRPKAIKKPVNSDWRTTDQAHARVIRDSEVQPAQYMADGESNPLPPAIERKPYVYEEFDEEPTTQPPQRMASRDRQATAGPRPLPEELVPITEVPTAEELLRENLPASPSPARRASNSMASQPPQRLYTDAPAAGSLRVEQIEEYNRMRRAQLARQRGEEPPDDPSPVVTNNKSMTWDQADGNSDRLARTDRTINRANRSLDQRDQPARLPDANDPATDEPRTTSRGLERSIAKRDAIERTLDSGQRESLVAQIEPDVARTDQERIDRLKSGEKSQSTAFNGDTPKTTNEWMTRMTTGLAWWKKPASSALTTETAGIFCDFDATNQRIIDFELPDVKGRPVRFGQLPANLSLIVFWGTWCKPCHEIMPHLVELQRRLESDNVQIIGISYEEGALAERQKKVALAADRYGVNFPLLLGGKGGSEACPVRKSLGVQVYPTMILVDHNGRILWRDTGSTPATMGRLDRVLASHLRELESRQVARSDRDSNR